MKPCIFCSGTGKQPDQSGLLESSEKVRLDPGLRKFLAFTETRSEEELMLRALEPQLFDSQLPELWNIELTSNNGIEPFFLLTKPQNELSKEKTLALGCDRGVELPRTGADVLRDAEENKVPDPPAQKRLPPKKGRPLSWPGL